LWRPSARPVTCTSWESCQSDLQIETTGPGSAVVSMLSLWLKGCWFEYRDLSVTIIECMQKKTKVTDPIIICPITNNWFSGSKYNVTNRL
jgi:hypothetical protein